MSYGSNIHEHRRAVREEAVRDVLERGISVLVVAMTWDAPMADVEQWVKDAQADAAPAS